MVLFTRRWMHFALLATAVAGCRGGSDRQPAASSLGPVALLAADSGLYDVRDLTVDDQGRIWVLTGQEPFLSVFAPHGGNVVRFGRAGRGPMELSNPHALIPPVAGDSAVTVWDLGNRKLVTFQASGRVLGVSGWSSAPMKSARNDIRQISFGNPFHLGRIEGRYVAGEYDGVLTSGSDLINLRLVVIDPLTGPVDTIVDFGRDRPRNQARAALHRELVDIPLWAVCPPGALAVFDPFALTMVWHNSSGALIAKDTLPLVRHELTDTDIRHYLGYRAELEAHGFKFDPAELQTQIDKLVANRQEMFDRLAPIAVNLLCDHKGVAWLELFSTANDPRGFGREWIMVPPEGPTRILSFPAGFVPWHVSETRAVGLSTDSVGLQHVGQVGLISHEPPL